MTLLEARGIGRRADNVWLLRDVDMAVNGGDRLAVVGPSGSGKTLLLRALALLDPLQAGEIRWREDAVPGPQTPRFRSRVIYLHQQPALTEGTVEQNLRQPFALAVHAAKSFDRDRIVSLLESLGRDASFLNKEQRDLSGGESQITALLRALQLDPDLLLLDEPTAALDSEATNAIETLVRQWVGERPDARATVWVSHEESQARRVADHVLQVDSGQLKQET